MKKDNSISYEYILDKIRKKIFEILLNKGISKGNITLKRKTSEHVVEETFSVLDEVGRFTISIITKYYLLINPEKSPPYWYWYIKFSFPIKNSHSLSLRLKKESKLGVLKNIFRQKKIELYNSDFDKIFKLTSDHKFAHLEIITPNIQEKLLSITNNFTFLEVNKYRIEYLEELNQNFTYSVQERVTCLLDIGLMIGKNIELWHPNLE